MKRFQNRAVVSTMAFPVAAVYAAVVVLMSYIIHGLHWVCLLPVALSVYIMMQMNTKNVLLRVRSRMVSVCFTFLLLMCPGILTDTTTALLLFVVVMSVSMLMTMCQDKTRVGLVFYIAVAVSVVSMLWVETLWLLPLFVILMIRPLSSFTFRTLSAMLLGVLLPHWITLPWNISEARLNHTVMHFKSLMNVPLLTGYENLTIGEIADMFVLVVLGIIGILHFLRYSYEDKIRVRLLMRMVTLIFVFFTVTISLIPSYSGYVIPLLSVPSSILAAHFFAHTSTRMTDILFRLTIIFVVLVTIFNQCLTSLSSLALGVL